MEACKTEGAVGRFGLGEIVIYFAILAAGITNLLVTKAASDQMTQKCLCPYEPCRLSSYPTFQVIVGFEFCPDRGTSLYSYFFLGSPPAFFSLASAAATRSLRCLSRSSSVSVSSRRGSGIASFLPFAEFRTERGVNS